MSGPVVVAPDADGLAAAAAALQAGQPVVVPTDTVYGLAVIAGDPVALDRLFELKRRPRERSIAVLVADRSQAETLAAFPDAQVEVQGHTDDIGSDASNLALSQDRADSVLAYLVSSGVDAERLTAVGYGETVPVADNETPEGRQINRRVVFEVQS